MRCVVWVEMCEVRGVSVCESGSVCFMRVGARVYIITHACTLAHALFQMRLLSHAGVRTQRAGAWATGGGCLSVVEGEQCEVWM